MLIQRRGLNKRTTYLLITALVVMLGGGYFVYSQFYASSEGVTTLGTTGGSALVPSQVASLDDSIFDDPQLFTLERDQFAGYTEQTSGAAIDPKLPLAPVNVSIQNPGIGATLVIHWQTPAYANYTEARIYRSEVQNTLGTRIATLDVDQANRIMSYEDTSVENNRRYYYLIRLATSAGIESTNAVQSAAIATDDLPPAAPHNVSVVSVGDDLEVRWHLENADDVAAVRIYRSLVPGEIGELLVEGAPQSGSDETDPEYTYRDGSIDVNTTYYYTVTAQDASGNESSRDILSVPYNVNPFAPVDFTTS
ncbi:MAG: fibronectin type III domain-containing protein [Patescibacteria group bacterium]